MPPDQAPALGDQLGPEPRDRDRGKHAPEAGAGRMQHVRAPFEEAPGIAQLAPGVDETLESIGIDTHAI